MIFFLLAVAAMLGYSTYGTLIVHHVRKHDGLSVATVRNLSLIISMSPLLLLANPGNFSLLPEYSFKLIAAGFSGSISLIFSFWALRFLPIGIKTALGRIGSVVLVFLISWLWFGELPTFLEFAWIIPVIIGGIALATQKTKLDHLDERTGLGVILTLIGICFSSLSFVQMSDVARNLDPFIAGYGWETSIGIWLLAFGLIRWVKSGKPPLANIKKTELSRIALISAPTVIGTGCFSLAVTLGPIGIANAISTGSIFVSILMGHYLYHEKMTRKQWLWISVCVAGLLGLGLLS